MKRKRKIIKQKPDSSPNNGFRKGRQRKRKNFLPTLIITVTLWLTTLALIFFVTPTNYAAIPLFFVLLFFALLFTFSLILANARRGLIASTGITFFLLLRYLGVGHIVNLLLIVAVVITVEYYFSRY
jgi:hypothetical protein